ncbi:hypothetical protein ACTJKN_17210 [Pedobacter sp. 22163]|uniref:hypothetical protein n=1 Tax=Pedobacter sp. 22163 TaxID=3453883 RepID=UPI003F844FD0
MKTKNKLIPLRTRIPNVKTIAIILLSLIALITSRCAKDRLVSDAIVSKTLSANSPDLQKRLEAIKKSYEQQKLQQKLQPKKIDKISWTPDWDHPKIQVVNDSVSYVFYQLLGQVDVNGKHQIAKQINGRLYLMVKNELDFYKAFYYDPKIDPNEKISKNTKEFDLKSFTGNLLLSSLQNGGNYLLDYSNGRLSDSYRKKGVLAVKKMQSVKGTTSYWQQECNSVVRNCTFSSLSPSWCGGSVNIVFSPTCSWPQSTCGDVYSLVDSDEAVVCEDVWYPDPPTDPGDGGSGGGGGGGDGEFQPVALARTITIDPNTRPCLESIKNAVVNAAEFSVTMASLLKQVHNDNTKAQNAVLALANNTNISITLGEKTIPYQTVTNPDGTTSVRETHGETDPITGNIKLNTLVLNEASDLAVAATLIHEMMHSYFVWGANNLTGEEAMAFSDLNRYLFDQEDGTPHPYNYPELGAMQHMQMAETYVNSMANILATVAASKGIGASPDTSISLGEYCRDIFWGSLQQTSGLDAPNAARSKANSEREYKNQTGSTGKNDCQP